MYQKKLISIIIPVYNRVDTLARTVSSVLDQSYRPIEIIIVDDGSTEKVAIDDIRDLCSKNPDIIRSIRQQNMGPSLARQTGLESAVGEFIQYLDSDDIIFPGKLESQVNLLLSNTDCSVAMGLTHGIPLDTINGTSAKNYSDHTDYLYPSILNYRWWTTSTPLYRSEIAHNARWRDIKIFEDWDYELQIAAKGEKYCFTSDYVVDKSSSEGQLSRYYKYENRDLWLESKADVMAWMMEKIKAEELDRENIHFTKFIHKIISTGEEALEYSRADISKKMAVLAANSLKHNLRPNFIKRIFLLFTLSLFPRLRKL